MLEQATQSTGTGSSQAGAPQSESFVSAYSTTLFLSLANIVAPIVFRALLPMEMYSDGKTELLIQTIRTFILRIFNLYALTYSLNYKVCMHECTKRYSFADRYDSFLAFVQVWLSIAVWHCLLCLLLNNSALYYTILYCTMLYYTFCRHYYWHRPLQADYLRHDFPAHFSIWNGMHAIPNQTKPYHTTVQVFFGSHWSGEKSELNIPNGVLSLVYRQGLVWMGASGKCIDAR